MYKEIKSILLILLALTWALSGCASSAKQEAANLEKQEDWEEFDEGAENEANKEATNPEQAQEQALEEEGLEEIKEEELSEGEDLSSNTNAMTDEGEDMSYLQMEEVPGEDFSAEAPKDQAVLLLTTQKARRYLNLKKKKIFPPL